MRCLDYKISFQDIQNEHFTKVIPSGTRGIYFIYNHYDKVVYVGEGNLKNRFRYHLNDDFGISHHYKYFEYTYDDTPSRKETERTFIEELKPLFNIAHNIRNLIAMGFEYPPKYMPEYSKKAQELVQRGENWKRGLPLIAMRGR